jgi:hypothetical protein
MSEPESIMNPVPVRQVDPDEAPEGLYATPIKILASSDKTPCTACVFYMKDSGGYCGNTDAECDRRVRTDGCDVIFKKKEADAIIADLEVKGLGWDVGNAGRLIEARIWQWPYVVGRYRPERVEPLAAMLRGAIADMERNGVNK